MLKILIPLIAFWVSSVTGVPQWFKFKINKVYPNAKFKPFTCSRCMGLHLAVIHEWYYGFSVDSLWYIPLCSLGGWALENLAIKLKLNIN